PFPLLSLLHHYFAASHIYPLPLHDALPISEMFAFAFELNHLFITESPERYFNIFETAYTRSEERRVGKECRSRCWPEHEKKKEGRQGDSRQRKEECR